MSIKVEGVSKLYGDQKALDQVSFEIKPGEIVGFLGPNGAGKSTMMKVITGYLPQSAGKVTVCDFDVSVDALEIKKRIGYLPEHNPQYLEMYVREYLMFIADVHGLKQAKKRVEEMIDLVGLTREQGKKIEALSKGYRQRVGLAQALIHDPEVLVLDEPTSGLDPNQIVEIRNVIKSVGQNKTVLMSTHIMQEVEAICDRVIIINKGELVADGSTAEIRKLSASVQRVEVEFNRVVDSSELRAIPGVQRVTEKAEQTYVIEANTDSDIRSDVFEFAVSSGIKVIGLQEAAQNLEGVFQQLTQKEPVQKS